MQDLQGALLEIEKHHIGEALFTNLVLWRSGLERLRIEKDKGIITSEDYGAQTLRIADNVLGALSEIKDKM